MEFFKINIMFGIVGCDKCNVIVYAVDVFYHVNVLLVPLIGFLYYWSQ